MTPTPCGVAEGIISIRPLRIHAWYLPTYCTYLLTYTE